MTINEIISIVDTQCPNQIDKKEKIRHLSALERRVINEVLSIFLEAKYDKDFRAYDADSDGSAVLLVDSPYDQMYVHYLIAQIQLVMLEQGHYNNQMYIFNSIFDDYKSHCFRTMRPSRENSRYRVR